MTNLLSFCRQKEALKNAAEAFQEEKRAHIELFEKQQKVKLSLCNIAHLFLPERPEENILFYYINTNEIPGELSRENLIKITYYLHM